MKNKLITLLLFFLISIVNAQKPKSGFKKLSSQKKCWVIFHPFKAKRAYRISIAAQKTADSIAQTNLLDQDKNGGQVDAFRHAYWMATLAQEIGKNSAKNMGKAHEKGNYKYFKKNKLEDGSIPDKPSSKMDLFNNNIGITIFKENKNASNKELIVLILENINNGNLKVLKKDSTGNYQNCTGEKINLNEYIGKWNNPKCLINSDTEKG